MTDLLLATAGEDVRLWTMPELNLHSVKSSSSNSVNHCVCSSNGQLLAYANEDQGISVAFLQGQSTLTFEIPTACEQSSVAFSNNSRYIVSGGRDCIVNVWDVKSRTVRRTFRDHVHPVSSCLFNFNDKIVASSSDHGEIILTEVSTGSTLSPLIGVGTDTINCISYSYFTHSLLASADSSGSVTLWDVSDNKLLKTFADHNSSATSLAFSPLNDMLLSSTGFDKRIIFYDVCYKKIVKTINTEEPLTSCDFLHDGTTVAVGSVSGRVYIFDLRHGASPLKVIQAHKTSVKSTSFQRLSKERTSRYKSSTSTSSSNGMSNKDVPPDRGSMELPMEVSPVPQSAIKRSQNVSQGVEVLPVREKMETSEKYEKTLSQEDTTSQCSSNSNNLIIPSKSAKMDDVFSPIALETSGRKPVTRSKSALKKCDLKTKNIGAEGETSRPGLGIRSKSGLSRFSLLSRSTGDLSRNKSNDDTKKNKEKNIEDISSPTKKHREIEKESLEGKKSILNFKSPFRKKNRDINKGSDDSETSSVESLSIEDKIYVRGKKSHASNRSNDSDTRSIGGRTTEVTQSMSPASKHIVIDQNDKNDTGSTLVVDTDVKASLSINPSDVSSPSIQSHQNVREKFPIEFIQNMIDEAMEENRLDIHNDICDFQVEFIRQMEIQKEQINQMLEHYSVNEGMVMEIQRLRIENEMLKRKY